METACHLFRRMVKDGIRPDLKTYTVLVDSLCLLGKVDDALCYFEELKQSGLSLNIEHLYNFLMKLPVFFHKTILE